MVISAKVQKRPRIIKYCSCCDKPLEPGNPRVRLYGYACEGDPAYVIYEHIECALLSKCAKVKEAIKQYNKCIQSDLQQKAAASG